MLHNSNRFVIGTCPDCAETVKGKFNIFCFSGKKDISFSCHDKECGKELCRITEAKNEYRISFDCIACGEIHNFTMKKQNFWGKKYFAFSCPIWEVGVLYFGNDDKFIEKQMNTQDELLNIALDNAISYAYTVTYDLIDCINELAQAGKIKCGCKNPDIHISVNDNVIVLSCKNCKNTKEILATEENIDKIIKTGTIVLDNTTLN